MKNSTTTGRMGLTKDLLFKDIWWGNKQFWSNTPLRSTNQNRQAQNSRLVGQKCFNKVKEQFLLTAEVMVGGVDGIPVGTSVREKERWTVMRVCVPNWVWVDGDCLCISIQVVMYSICLTECGSIQCPHHVLYLRVCVCVMGHREKIWVNYERTCESPFPNSNGTDPNT